MNAMRLLSVGAAVVAFTLCAGASVAQDYFKSLGVGAGVFFPVDRSARDAFGDTWFSWGIRPVSFDSREGFKVAADVNVLARRAHGNRLTILSATLGVGRTFGEGDSNAQPYAIVRAGPAYFDYAVTQPGGARVSAQRIGVNGNVELGVILGDRLRLSARYDLFSNFDGLKFDGVSLSLVYQVYRF
jgi:hypothetical protein